ncbi:hypothetical protein [Desulfobaculum sp.]|jgi:hypothetical protein
MSLVINDIARVQHDIAYGLLRDWVRMSKVWNREDAIVSGVAHFIHGLDMQRTIRPLPTPGGLPTPDVSVPEVGAGTVWTGRV